MNVDIISRDELKAGRWFGRFAVVQQGSTYHVANDSGLILDSFPAEKEANRQAREHAEGRRKFRIIDRFETLRRAGLTFTETEQVRDYELYPRPTDVIRVYVLTRGDESQAWTRVGFSDWLGEWIEDAENPWVNEELLFWMDEAQAVASDLRKRFVASRQPATV